MKRGKTSSFLLELPLEVSEQQAKRLHAHLEAARCLYNALLGQARTRLRRMRADPGWNAARGIPGLWNDLFQFEYLAYPLSDPGQGHCSGLD